MERTPLETMQVHPIIGKTLTPDQVAYVAQMFDDISTQKGHCPFTLEEIQTILLDRYAFQATGQDFLKKSEIIRQNILISNTGAAPEIAKSLYNQQNLRDKVHKALLKCLVLTEHAQQNCEQALQSTAAKYSSTYQTVMQQHLAEYHQHMDLLKKMTSKSML